MVLGVSWMTPGKATEDTSELLVIFFLFKTSVLVRIFQRNNINQVYMEI